MSFNNTKTPTRAVITKKARYQVPMRKKMRVMEYYLTPELEDKFRKLYPTTFNCDMMQLFGIGYVTMQRFKKELGLVKDTKVIRHKLAKKVKKICEDNGYYESLKGKTPSEQCREAAAMKRASGWHPLKELKKKNPRKYKKFRSQCRAKRLLLERSERFRVDNGLITHTNLHRPLFKFTRQQVNYRHNMLIRGYILGDMSDHSGERYVIFYDKDTTRSPVVESRASNYGFQIQQLQPNKIQYRFE